MRGHKLSVHRRSTARLAFAALLALGLAGGAARARANVHVCVTPSDSTVNVGDPVTVRIYTNDPITDVQGYAVRLTYGTTPLGPPTATGAGTMLDPVPAVFFPYSAAPDTLGFDAAVLGTTTAGPGTLGTFSFVATNPGDSHFHVTVALMRDSHNDPIQTVTCDGVIHVVSGIHVCIAPADTAVSVGDPVVVRITTDGPPADLQGYSVRLTFNSTALGAPLATSPGTVLSAVPNYFFPYSAAPDTIGFDAGILGTTSNGPGTLGTFSFIAQNTGTSTFHMTLAIMRDSHNDDLPVTLCDGQVRVLPPTSTVPKTWGAIKSLFSPRR